jgi:hypothetical protein
MTDIHKTLRTPEFGVFMLLVLSAVIFITSLGRYSSAQIAGFLGVVVGMVLGEAADRMTARAQRRVQNDERGENE